MSQVVVVGAGQAGANVARRLRSDGWAGPITLVGAEQHSPYERPMLSKELMHGQAVPADLHVMPDQDYAELGIDLVLGQAGQRLDVGARRLELANGQALPYEHLVLAIGSTPRELSAVPADGERVITFRTLGDALALRAHARPGTIVAIVGAGLIGLELASSLSALGCHVQVIDVARAPAPRAFVAPLAALVEQMLLGAGVRFHWGCEVRQVQHSGDGARLALTDGTSIDADIVVVCAGTTANVDLAAAAGIACRSGILVDAQGRTDVPGVWAVGDCAEFIHPLYGSAMRLEQWQHANEHAAAVSRAICGGGEAYTALPWAWTEVLGRRIALIGSTPSHDELVWLGMPGEAGSAAVLLENGHPRAVQGFVTGRTGNALRKALAARAGLDRIAEACGLALHAA